MGASISIQAKCTVNLFTVRQRIRIALFSYYVHILMTKVKCLRYTHKIKNGSFLTRGTLQIRFQEQHWFLRFSHATYARHSDFGRQSF